MARPPKRKTLKSPGKCIFCNGGDLSKQHIWPQWMRNLVLNGNTAEAEEFWSNDGSEIVRSKKRQGSPASMKLRRVCRSCNHGWMREVEEAAMPILEKLIPGYLCVVTKDDQLALARWITLLTIVTEFAEPALASIPKIRREAFFNTREPLPHGSIWIGHQTGGARWQVRFWRSACDFHAVNSVTGEPIAPKTDAPRNTQMMTMGFRRLFVHSVSSEIEEFPRWLTLPGAFQIWPIENDVITWPMLANWNDAGLDALSTNLTRSIELLNEHVNARSR